jgi:excisionase family DNA binding protein
MASLAATPRNNDATRERLASERAADAMTVDELAQRLGVAPKTVYAAIRRKQIPGVLRVGRLVRLSRSAVLAWLDGQPRDARSRSPG